MLKNTRQHWGSLAKWLHWVLALLIIGQGILGKVAEEMERSPAKLDAFVWHKSLGVLILLLVLTRLVWRWANPSPELPASTTRREVWAARISHGLLYTLMILIPVSGWVASDTSRIPLTLFRMFPAPDLMAANHDLHEQAGEIHELLVTGLLVLLIIHVTAALYHHLVRRDTVLRRMLPGKS